MALLDYLDTYRATKNVLKDYHDIHWKAENCKDNVQQIKSDMESVHSGASSTIPVSGGGNRTEDFLASCIDRKPVAEYRRNKAVDDATKLDQCFGQLTEEEQQMLTWRFIDYDEEGSGIKRIMDEYHISQREAYRRSNRAWDRLAKLLYW